MRRCGRPRLSRLSLVTLLTVLASAPLTTGQVAAQAVATARETRVDAGELMRVVTELASPRYEGRLTGTPGGRAARDFVRQAFTAIGLEPAGTSGFEQPFEFTHSSRGSRTKFAGVNLIGAVKGTTSSRRTIIVTAHYDHLGVRNGRMYPGADDNASGVAALLAIARYVKAHPLAHPVLFAAFDGEELGLAGSKAFIDRPARPLREIALNVNLDMVSRNARNEIYAAGTYHHPWLKPLVEDVQQRAAVRVLFGHDRPGTGDDDWTLQSDHGSFHRAGVPFIYFGVEDHPDYHQPTDTPDKIGPVFFRNVVEMLLDAVLAFDRALEREKGR
jgi:Zn-dependent M28 family amino/carboxypeptidase